MKKNEVGFLPYFWSMLFILCKSYWSVYCVLSFMPEQIHIYIISWSPLSPLYAHGASLSQRVCQNCGHNPTDLNMDISPYPKRSHQAEILQLFSSFSISIFYSHDRFQARMHSVWKKGQWSLDFEKYSQTERTYDQATTATICFSNILDRLWNRNTFEHSQIYRSQPEPL